MAAERVIVRARGGLVKGVCGEARLRGQGRSQVQLGNEIGGGNEPNKPLQAFRLNQCQDFVEGDGVHGSKEGMVAELGAGRGG